MLLVDRPLAELLTAAEGGDLTAMDALGERCCHGIRGAPKDDVQALYWWRRAAAANVASAQFNLGIMHRDGEGGLKMSHDEAVKLYRAAAGAGHPGATYDLGFHLSEGLGVPQDRAEAIRLWLQAAEKGSAQAEGKLADAFIDGEGVPKDYAAALNFARRAADKGDAGGINALASIYADGLGVPRNLRKAVTWYEKTAAKGDNVAIFFLRHFSAAGMPEAAAALRRLRLAP